jgi:hypothetical protein
VFWPQAEALIASLRLWQSTGDPAYQAAFDRQVTGIARLLPGH